MPTDPPADQARTPHLPGTSVPVPRASCVLPETCPVVRYAEQTEKHWIHGERRRWAERHQLRDLVHQTEELLRRLRLALEDLERPDDGPGPA